MEVRYLGFDQLRNARAFRFEMIAKGEDTKQAVVTADLALFLQFRVGIQDGPTLCASKLISEVENNFEGEHVLTGDDLRAYSASRAAAEEKRMAMRRMGRRKTPGTPFGNPRGRE